MLLPRRLFLALLLALFVALPVCAAEAVDPYRFFAAHYEAMGGLERFKRINSGWSVGTVRYDGLTGTFESWSEKPLRYRLNEDFGIIRQSEGDDGTLRWRKDTNGQVEEVRDEETLKRRRIAELLENFEHLNPDSPWFSLSDEGHAAVEGIPCRVLRLDNRINSDVSRFFFAVDDLRVVKTVDTQPDVEIHTRYDDYRRVDGLWLPFRQVSNIHPRNKHREIVITAQRIDPPVNRQRFAKPAPATGAIDFPANDRAENIPFLFSENLIYLPVTLKGDTRWWILDSGASMSVIDADYAASLGLTPEGSIGGFGFGDLFTLSFVRLPPCRVGELTLPAQTIHAYKGLAENSYEPVRVGILGYDFLSRFVTRIDYARRTISFYRPESFVYQGPGKIVDAPLKYRTFSLPARIDDLPDERFSLDLGSHRSSLHHPFAARHGLLKRPGVQTVSKGMASFSFETLSAFDRLEIAGFSIDRPLLTIPDEAGAGTAAVGELAGTLGNSLLRHFVLTLDYGKQQVMIEAGAEFNETFPEDHSGLLVGQGENGGPMVSFVAAGTPAQEAGFLAGDVIATVDGRPAAEYGGVLPIRELLRRAPGTKFDFTLLRQGREVHIELVLRELF
ncbi:aspartyl protease family protein [Trichloromonas sp.]|uniref:aspartyl protease family protein n=1 Tax=Trichloromonas sp. TaxID=3069249 RepID=UPI002A3822D9|nr:aspartyl protease family protein [Trichloromonas sp.]